MSNPSIIAERRRFLEEMERELKLLEDDLLLKREGFRYSYVVDFSAIYAYIYKTFTWRSIQGVHSKWRERTFARWQVALKLLFADPRRPLLLIPPYAAELRNHLDLISMQIDLAGIDLRERYIITLKRLISRSPEFRSFIRLGHDPRAAALEVGKSFFPELYAVVTCAVTRSLDTLRNLFATGVLKDAEPELPEMKDFSYDSSRESTDKWYAAIMELRKEDRAYQSFVDALACSYIEIANKKMNADRRIIVFVSPSGHVKQTIADQELIHTPTGLRLTVVRNLDYFLLSSTHRDDLSKIRDTLRLFQELLRVYGRDQQLRGSLAEQSRRLLQDTDSLWRQAENRLLLSDSILLDEIKLLNIDQSIQERFLALLQLIAEAAEQESVELERQAGQLITELRDGIVHLDRLVPVERFARVLGELEVKRLKQKVRIRFPALQDELPVTIEFHDTFVAQLARRLEGTVNRPSATTAIALRQEIMELASKEDGNTEHCFLAAYLLAMESKLDAALAEVHRCLRSNKAGGRKELLFLAALLHRKLTQPLEAKELILQALSEDKSEPRFQLECGRILWQLSFRESSEADRDVSLLRQAIGHFTLCLSKESEALYDPEFRAQVENALAYVYCELAFLDPDSRTRNLELAENHLSRLGELLPVADWIGRFHDTTAWVQYAKWFFCHTDVTHQERRRWLSDARTQIELAVKRSRSRGAMDLLLQRHRNEIERAMDSAEGTGS
jgi:hypothetical protein